MNIKIKTIDIFNMTNKTMYSNQKIHDIERQKKGFDEFGIKRNRQIYYIKLIRNFMKLNMSVREQEFYIIGWRVGLENLIL